MKEEIKNKFPSWVEDNKKYYMCLTDDIDSLFSCMLLQKIKGYEISHFYSFNTLYKNENYKSGLKMCGIDMDLAEGRCWGNHVTGLSNPKSANLNVIKGIESNNYFSKFCGSTLLEIISFYNYDISNLNEEAMMVLLCIDGMYIPFFPWKIDFSGTQRKYLKDMELEELIEVADRHSKEEFEEIIKKYKLNKKIFVNENGELKTGIDLNGLSSLFDLSFILPKNKFTETNKYKNIGVNTYNYNSFVKKLHNNGYEVFSQAQTNKNYIKLSYEI